MQLQSTWEDVTKMVKKTEVHKDDLKERSDAEIQRSGQPLCIYEPYHGEGSWAFLHDENTLYRGLSLVSNSLSALAINKCRVWPHRIRLQWMIIPQSSQ